MSGSTEDRIKEIVETTVLFDFYSELLKDQTREIIEDYVLNDYSLAEIAEKLGITRQGVRDFVKRGEAQLREYESKLHLASKYKMQEETGRKLEEGLKELKETSSGEQQKKIDDLLLLVKGIGNS